MNDLKNKYALYINHLTLIGVLFFLVIYIYSATLYPGGSQADPIAAGFDWVHNYWCNLLNDKAMNGETNPARSIAVIAMIVLCFSLVIFFFQFAEYLAIHSVCKKIIRIGGLLSMTFAAMIFTVYHDLMTIIASFFGLFVVLCIIREIYKSRLAFYKYFGVLSLLLMALNNYIYYTSHGIEWLPLLQKFTFLIVLGWVVGLNFELRNRIIERRSAI